MPSVEENAVFWNVDHDWAGAGEEWSKPWGGSEAQWFGAILPRIARFLPAETVLEIAPGYGRWTSYLRQYCDRLVVVDLSSRCIEACQARFAGDDRIAYHVNDGRSLDMVEDESIDFVFSFDSLVHVEADDVASYAHQLARKLKPNGAGFIHHSNSGEYRWYFQAVSAVQGRPLNAMYKARIVDNLQSRALSMDASRFCEQLEAAGLQCIGQELINWGTRRRIDCLSTFTTRTSSWSRPNRVLVNRGFTAEAKAIKRRAHLYSGQP